MDLSKQIFVVFGGSSGIGLSLAQHVLRDGGTVGIVGRSPERLKEAARSLACPDRLTTYVADIAHEEQVEQVFHQLGNVDHIVTTAADPAYEPIPTFNTAAARRIIDSKLLGGLILAKVGGAHIRSGGSLTFTSGIAADRPAPRGSMVAAVNGALNAFVRAAALELAPIRVNAISPGWVDTPIWDGLPLGDKSAVQEEMAKRLPVGRIGRPADIASAIVFLSQNQFTTGAVLHVDGGHRFA